MKSKSATGLVAIVLAIGLMACSADDRTPAYASGDDAANGTLGVSMPSASPAASAAVPSPLEEAGGYGESIYDDAKANDWTRAAADMALLEGSLGRLRLAIPGEDRLRENAAALRASLTEKNRTAAMREANQVTLDVANISAQYRLTVPVEVARLDYYGRELEIWADAKDTGRLQATAQSIRQEWDAVRGSVERRSSAEEAKFSVLVGRVEGATTIADYKQLATPILDEVDNLEKVFTSDRRRRRAAMTQVQENTI